MHGNKVVMRKYIYIYLFLLLSFALNAQEREELIPVHPPESTSGEQQPARKDTLPRLLPIVLPSEVFIPNDRLEWLAPWTSAPITRPVVHSQKSHGFLGSIGFGEYSLVHPDKFFSTLSGYNSINIPHIFLTQQMLLGNTFRLGRNIYYMSGIMYGAQMGVRGNNWGMGAREGFIWNPTSAISIVIWTQEFQSVVVYTPVIFPDKNGSGAAITMPATPEVFSFGVQANFVVGDFIIGVGTSVAPVPFQKRKHSEFRYK